MESYGWKAHGRRMAWDLQLASGTIQIQTVTLIATGLELKTVHQQRNKTEDQRATRLISIPSADKLQDAWSGGDGDSLGEGDAPDGDGESVDGDIVESSSQL